MMREAYRLQKNELSRKLADRKIGLSIFIIYSGNELPEYSNLHQRMGKLLARLIEMINENPEGHN